MTESVSPETPAEDDVREINPFMVIRRGEDTVTSDDRIVFSDFSPKVLPADVPDEEPVVAPKAVSAPAPASLQGQPTTGKTEPKKSASPAQEPAAAVTGKPSQSGSSSQTSSSAPKNG